jgi:flagellar biosynthesis/type III secretory pathway M-ring protein FliF/YscJ
LKAAAAVLLILVLLGIFILWVIFFAQGNKKASKTANSNDKDKEAKKVLDLIKRLEKENPEMVSKIRSQLIADKKMESVKETDQEEISGVVKHWMSDKSDE